jgi:hypothetical protein
MFTAPKRGELGPARTGRAAREEGIGLQLTQPVRRPGGGACLSHPRTVWGRPCQDSEPEFGLERAFLEAFLDRHQEAGCVGAIDQPVIVGQRQVDHRPDGYYLAKG